MTRLERIEVMVKLGEYLKDLQKDEIQGMIELANLENQWFTLENISLALHSIKSAFLNEEKINEWIEVYDEINQPKKVGLILAGNIPAVGWNDIFCTFLSGHIALIKYSEKDKVIIPFLIKKLIELNPQAYNYFIQVERLMDYDGVIATGSDNTSRYFQSYFGHKPNIIRKNRNGIGVFDGSEDKNDFINLGKDIFTYFGLGCRNVSKLYVPRGYVFSSFLETLHYEYKELAHHNKYKNNFDYNIALFLLNKVNYLNNGCLIILEDQRFLSRIASLHYEFYDDKKTLENHLNLYKDNIQCIVSKNRIEGFEWFDLGQAQHPGLANYADGIDTMFFLSQL
jgi:hypothetical protein